jgi:hypothetical protein
MLENHDFAEVREAVHVWKDRKNQRYKALCFFIKTRNSWATLDELRENLPELKDSTTVLYDMALRNPNDTPKGKGYYDRFRVYPQGSEAKPILEHSKILGYRIKPEYLETVSQTA